MKKKLSFPTKIIIFDNILSKFFWVFTGIFLSAYFYKVSEDYVFQLAFYYVVSWIAATIGAVFLADIIKRKDKIWFYRAGILIRTVFAFIILVSGQEITNHIAALGILYGLVVATNGFPFNMIESENITNQERVRYLGYGNALVGIASIMAPAMIGLYATETSYIATSIPIIVLTIIELLASFFLKSKNHTTEKLNLKSFSKLIKTDKTLRRLYFIEFFKGINRNGVMSLVASLIIIRILPNDATIGGWSSVFSLLAVAAMFLFARFYKKTHQTVLIALSTLIIMTSTILVIIFPSFMSIIFYNIAFYVFLELIEKVSSLNLFNYSTKGIYKKRYNTEYFTFREIFLNTGRIFGYVVLMILALTGTVATALNSVFIVTAISIVIMSGLVMRTKV